MNSQDRASQQPPAPGPASLPTRTYFLCALVITLLSCLLNIGGLNQSEVIDDHDLLHNYSVRGCGKNPLDCFHHLQFGLYYRPLMGASYALGEDLHGQKPFPFHVENLVLHGAVVLLALWMFRLLLGCDRAALLAGYLFAVHPLQVPVTTFIGGRTDTLALFFLLWFVVGALKADLPRTGLLWRGVSLLAFTAALFTKEQTGLLLLLAPLFAASQNRGRTKPAEPSRPARWMLLYAAPILLFLICARNVIRPDAIDTVAWKPTARQVAWDAALRIEMVGRTLWYYVRAFLWPTPDTLHQSTLGPWDTPQPLTTLLGFFAAGVWLAVHRHVWPDPARRALALWTTLTLLPCLNLVPIPSQFVACYRAAIPLLGVAGLAGAAMAAEGQPGEPAWWRVTRRWVGPTVILSVLAVLSLVDVPVWRDDIAVERAEYRADPNFLPALAGLAGTLQSRGRYQEALAVYDRVIPRLFPGAATVEERIARARSPEMLRRVKSQSSLRYQSDDFLNVILRGKGGTEQALGLWSAAIDDYRVALALHPDDEEVADALARAYLVTRRAREAEALLKPMVARAPTALHLHRLGLAYFQQSRWAEARDTLFRALAETPPSDVDQMIAIQQEYETAKRYADLTRRTMPPPSR